MEFQSLKTEVRAECDGSNNHNHADMAEMCGCGHTWGQHNGHDCELCNLEGCFGKKGRDMEPEVGVGSPLKKWVCQCTTHVVNVKSGKTLKGPYIIRVSGDGLVAMCSWCDSPFVMAEEGLPRKRKSKICGAHCPEGAHEHV